MPGQKLSLFLQIFGRLFGLNFKKWSSVLKFKNKVTCMICMPELLPTIVPKYTFVMLVLMIMLVYFIYKLEYTNY